MVCTVPEFLVRFPVDALRRVVREPARRQGVEFASRLVDRILRDARAEAGALPLLEFTLSELWPRQCRRMLTREAYEEIAPVIACR